MEDALKKITSDVEAELRAWLDAPETRALIEETQKAADGDTGTFEVVITTENLDRYQEVISLDGWDLEHYRNNPVVLWGHDHHQLPIGVATSVEIKDGKMVASGKFAPHDFAQTIRQLYDMGMMRATSVGFIEKEREGNLITKAELLEFSFVSVPANPYALSTLVKSGVSINEMVTKGILHPGEVKEKEKEKAHNDGYFIVPKSVADAGKFEGILREVGLVILDQKDVGGAYQFRVKEAPEETPEEHPETPESELIVEEQPTDEPVVEEKQFQSKAIEPIVSSLKGAIVALEALSTKDGEPEGNEPEATEEEKQLADFTAKRKTLQDAATILGDVLAEVRQVAEAKQ